MTNNIEYISPASRAVNMFVVYLTGQHSRWRAVWIVALVAVLLTTASLITSRRVLAASLTWDGSASADWNDPNNWTPAVVPGFADDVDIPASGVTNDPTVSAADVTIHNLTISAPRVLTLNIGRTLTVDGTSAPATVFAFATIVGGGTFQTQGTVEIVKASGGAFTAPLSVLSGTTTANDRFNQFNAVFGGNISVASGATLSTTNPPFAGAAMVANADVTVDGTLTGNNIFRFNGATFTNNGNVSVAAIEFNRNGAQTIAGTGTWTGGSLTIGQDNSSSNSSNTSLANAVTMAVGTININDSDTTNDHNILTVNFPLTINGANFINRSGGAVAISSTLTFDGGGGAGKIFNTSGTVTGAGTFQTKGTVELNKTSGSGFSAPISVISGTTTVHDKNNQFNAVFGGNISVASGATLSTTNPPFAGAVMVANADVTVDGTLNGANIFRFNGATFTNNGNVSVAAIEFNRDGAQTIAGTGTWTGGSLTIGQDNSSSNSSNTSLANAVTMAVGTININDSDTTSDHNILTVNFPLTINGANFINRFGGAVAISSTLTFDGGGAGKIFNTSGAVTGTGTFQTKGTVELNKTSGSGFSAPISVISGTTTAHDKDNQFNAVFGGNISVASGATLSTTNPPFAGAVMIANADVTVDGTLNGANIFRFNGATFTNNGNVSVAAIEFNRNGAQTIAGTGTWTGGSLTIGQDNSSSNSSNTSLANAVTMAVGTININDSDTTNDHNVLTVNFPLTINGANFINRSGGAVAISSTLTFDGGGGAGKIFNTTGAVTGTGTFQTQGTVELNKTSAAGFSAPISVISGTTTAHDKNNLSNAVFGGNISVASGATLSTTNPPFAGAAMVANADVTVDGTLNGANTFRFNGATFTNNGNVSVASFEFNRAGAQSLTGTGAFASNTATVIAGSTVTLGSDHQMSRLVIDGGGGMNITARTLSLSAGGTPLTNNGTFTTTGSTVVYNGSSAQSVATANVNYSSLAINNVAGVSLGAARSVPGTLTLTNGVFSIGGNLTMGNGALIRRSEGSLSAVPSFGASVNVEYFGANAIATGPEMPASTTVLNNLTINNSAGVSLSADATVNGILALTSGDLTTGAFTLTMPGAATSTGTTDVVGNVKRTGFVTGTPLSFGNPFNSIGFASGTLPTDIVVNLVKATPPTPPFATAVNRTYTITPTGGSGFSATVRLHYLDSDLNGNSEAMLTLWRYDGTNWHKEGRTGNDTADNWVEKSGVTAFSPWTMNSTVPTEVTLMNCTASSYDGGVFVQWQTGYEVNNLGFNVYRDQLGKRELVNSQMIAGSALVAGSGVEMRAGRSYGWWDKGIGDCRLPISDCRNVTYWLEDLDINGKSTLHGPFTPKSIGGAPPARIQSALLSQIGENEPIITAQAASLPIRMPLSKGALIGQPEPRVSLAGGPALKFGVRSEGWYRVTQGELLAVGLDPSVDPRNLQLFVGGVEQAVLVTGESDGRLDSTDTVEFYGNGLDTPSSDTHLYWLVAGKERGKRINISASHGKPGGGRTFSYTVESKERSIYFSGLLNGETQNFFGRVVASQAVEQSIPLQHLDTTSLAAEVEVGLQGVTDQGGSADHQVSIALNGVHIGRMVFDGREHKVERFSIYATLLKEGENTVTLTGQGGDDVTLVDYVRITYSHTYAADNDKLTLTANLEHGESQTIEGFSTPLIRVMDVSDPAAVQELGGEIESWKDGSFAVTVDLSGREPRRLMTFADDEIKRPASITANQPSSWRSAANGADMLIITQRGLAASLQPLRALRQSQGLSVSIVEVEDIYDEFNFGEKTPQALKDFINYAATSWKKKPRFVLLAGDASFDTRNYLGFGDNDLVPTKLIDTQLMETASDAWLADFNNDGLSEVAVGRLPVRTATEATMMVAKIVGYERSSASEEVLLVSDESSGYDFEGASTRLMPLVPGNLRVGRLDRGLLDPETAKKKLMEAIYRGQKIVNYAGHGSVDVWSGSLMTGSDARALENRDHLSLFVMMTCLNGYFHEASIDSLGEALMKADGGAIAVWASTGMTGPIDQWTMNEELYRLVFGSRDLKGKTLTIGEAAERAKARITDADIRRTWVLLGDPAMRLR